MKPRDLLSQQEIDALLRKSDLRGAVEIFTTWGLIASAFAGVALWPHLPTIFVPILLAWVLLGNRHLALAILVHDAGHHAVFRTRWLNEFAGSWFAAAPSLIDLEGYRQYHLQHHKYTGQDYQHGKGDPDIILTRNYPISKKSLTKWLQRDLTFRSGPRLYLGLIAMKLGIIRYDLSGRVEKLTQPPRSAIGWIFFGARRLFPFVVSNAVIFTALALTGNAWLFLLWPASQLTTFQFFTRVRSIAEHGMLPRVPDMFKNTRTTEVSFWERLTFAPCHVNYHMEHHFMMAVPSYRLPQLHRLLKDRGVFDKVYAPKGYIEILRLATAKL